MRVVQLDAASKRSCSDYSMQMRCQQQAIVPVVVDDRSELKLCSSYCGAARLPCAHHVLPQASSVLE